MEHSLICSWKHGAKEEVGGEDGWEAVCEAVYEAVYVCEAVSTAFYRRFPPKWMSLRGPERGENLPRTVGLGDLEGKRWLGGPNL